MHNATGLKRIKPSGRGKERTERRGDILTDSFFVGLNKKTHSGQGQTFQENKHRQVRFSIVLP